MSRDSKMQRRARAEDLYEQSEALLDSLYEDHSACVTPADRLSAQSITECRSASNLMDELARHEIIKLVLRLFLAGDTTNHRAILLAGVDRNNSTAFITSWTGEILAELTRATICLVDADLRSPSLHECFGLKNDKGLADLLQNSHLAYEEVTQRISPNLWVLTAGNPASNPNTFVATETMQPNLVTLTEQFQYVLICAAPICSSVDAVAIGRLCDGVLMILEAEMTRKDAALRARRLLDSGGVRLIGAVLNNRRLPIPERSF